MRRPLLVCGMLGSLIAADAPPVRAPVPGPSMKASQVIPESGATGTGQSYRVAMRSMQAAIAAIEASPADPAGNRDAALSAARSALQSLRQANDGGCQSGSYRR